MSRERAATTTSACFIPPHSSTAVVTPRSCPLLALRRTYDTAVQSKYLLFFRITGFPQKITQHSYSCALNTKIAAAIGANPRRAFRHLRRSLPAMCSGRQCRGTALSVFEGSRGRHHRYRSGHDQLLRGHHGGPGCEGDREHRGGANYPVCSCISGVFWLGLWVVPPRSEVSSDIFIYMQQQ